jgi:hypothetical protein
MQKPIPPNSVFFKQRCLLRLFSCHSDKHSSVLVVVGSAAKKLHIQPLMTSRLPLCLSILATGVNGSSRACLTVPMDHIRVPTSGSSTSTRMNRGSPGDLGCHLRNPAFLKLTKNPVKQVTIFPDDSYQLPNFIGQWK